MEERRQAFVVTGVTSLAIALILLLIRATEGAGVWIAGYAGMVFAGVAAGCAAIAIVMDVIQSRPWKSGTYNFQYYRLKKRTKKFLQ